MHALGNFCYLEEEEEEEEEEKNVGENIKNILHFLLQKIIIKTIPLKVVENEREEQQHCINNIIKKQERLMTYTILHFCLKKKYFTGRIDIDIKL